jgi:hypothetical protein
VEDQYQQIQLPHSWVRRLTEELKAEILERQAGTSKRRVLLTKTLAKLAEERGKLLEAFYANAIPPPLFSRPSSNERLKVEVRGFEPLTPAVRRQCSTGLSYTPGSASA